MEFGWINPNHVKKVILSIVLLYIKKYNNTYEGMGDI